MCLLYVHASLTCIMDVIVLSVLDIFKGWYLGQGLLLGAMVEAMDVDMVELLVSMSLSMVGLNRKRAGKCMLVNNMKRIKERAMLSRKRLI